MKFQMLFWFIKPQMAASVVETNSTDTALFTNKQGELCLNILAKPGAKETRVTGIQTDAVAVRIGAQPVDGEANKELIRYVSKLLGVPKSDVTLDRVKFESLL
jgi:uncharacterized protein YggU (UPF0235/DUF167 family)